MGTAGRIAGAVFAVLLYAQCMQAQGEAQRFHASVGYSYLRTELGANQNTNFFGGSGTLFLNRSFGVDFSLARSFRDLTNKQTSPFDGGQTTQGQFGILWGKRSEPVSLFLKVRPGFLRHGEAWDTREANPQFLASSPPKALWLLSTDIGAVAELTIHRRSAIRFDVGNTLIRYPEIYTNVPVRTTLFRPAWKSNFQFSVGITYRYGKIGERKAKP